MTKIKDVTTLVKTKFVGLYDVEYENKNNDIRHWMVASRKDENNLKEIYINDKEDKIDAVVIAAYHKSEKKLVLIKQFRVPINSYIYELPAGLVDNEEGIEKAVKRELKEETGLELISINNINSNDKLYLSPGMTDESVAFVYCLCDGNLSKEFLEEDEDIEAFLVSKEEAKEIINGREKIDIKSYLLLQMFINLGEKLFH
ncbi:MULTISPECIES: NUDIX hydrolase [Romboutsia]|uniref:Hydrolase, NUDIX n=1 Tax=Romboutsia hominis TaxID=1507512 RepID=A0A2P2BPT8_9FIRM|nr:MULTISPECIES: NUDIX hydrolase [Romboutsia]MCH1959680.1 NUDIX hydrolase [Romboutsia hominis]MCH1969897.1 NUDIX hydrolase [Romboutsia hominis]MDB8790920.1 NUDIX hydrolase [Romboutsia sp. 1001216sp1]MDB8792454.1 NUDIX hydrolase [Romboutsia sp. 1001216sp1]MDB8795749.1 NUDIX hydrolase [Romboutsia sp. 1001216sp1]